MQSDFVRPWQDSALVKEGDDAVGHTKWHNDIEFSPFSGEKMAILWVALTDVAEENAPVVTVLRSHEGSIRYTHAEGELPPGYRPYQELLDIATAPDAPNRAWTMRAGDCLVMHMATIHSSMPRAKGAARRVAYSQRWLGDDVIYQPNEITRTLDPALTPDDFEDAQVHDGVRFSFVNDEVIEMTLGGPPPDGSFPITWQRREPAVV
jgi:ectoine hydroxylase-related dioxygenase (phytanoyl-CoA dioxygenase family)